MFQIRKPLHKRALLLEQETNIDLQSFGQRLHAMLNRPGGSVQKVLKEFAQLPIDVFINLHRVPMNPGSFASRDLPHMILQCFHQLLDSAPGVLQFSYPVDPKQLPKELAGVEWPPKD